MFWIYMLVGVVLFSILAGLLVRAKNRTLRAAPKGAVRVEAVKASQVNTTVTQYARAGWTVTDQTTAKSLGSQARVTLTFRKTG